MANNQGKKQANLQFDKEQVEAYHKGMQTPETLENPEKKNISVATENSILTAIAAGLATIKRG